MKRWRVQILFNAIKCREGLTGRISIPQPCAILAVTEVKNRKNKYVHRDVVAIEITAKKSFLTQDFVFFGHAVDLRGNKAGMHCDCFPFLALFAMTGALSISQCQDDGECHTHASSNGRPLWPPS